MRLRGAILVASGTSAKSEIEPIAARLVYKLAKAAAATAAAARGGRAPKPDRTKSLVNALFRANGSVRAASLGALCGNKARPQFSLYIRIDIDMYEDDDNDPHCTRG